jgi:hypothetical protein
MKSFVLFVFLSIGLLNTLSAAPKIIDYGLISATPYISETNLGRERMDKFLAKMNPKKQALLAQTPYVAVQAGALTAGEVGTIMRRLNSGNARGITTGYGERPADAMGREVKFILVFDSRTRQLAGEDGVLSVDTPGRGRIGIFGGFTALYIEKGY